MKISEDFPYVLVARVGPHPVESMHPTYVEALRTACIERAAGHTPLRLMCPDRALVRSLPTHNPLDPPQPGSLDSVLDAWYPVFKRLGDL